MSSIISVRRVRRTVLPTLAAAVAAAGVTALLPGSAVAATPRCAVDQLDGAFKNASAGAGSRTATLVLTNTSRSRCSLFGYPGAQLLNARNRDLPTNIVRDRSRSPKTVVLAPGGRAVSQWRWGAIAGSGEPQNRACEPNPARIEVTPPNATRFLVLPWKMGPVCEKGEITVRPMAAG
ncbi:DUF4232 domain-containing protein [Conexibacter woesei]|uniref:DUF4232 domain-containing protein n=1 Tax=Conexibacter woesei (strain DSM 14684 / CCUG 47730 / CIP 108061 / JCM 11494 / NBRC 100937 / ID131577) TaxID=469383 RepID=D3EZH9_CONWI|nr:DUF4232 domain-containing protein [Conexibacter woesei]ADB53817.1 hypothetical protein Cwoe_5412 [Conexibacter woesei DSM 14684]